MGVRGGFARLAGGSSSPALDLVRQSSGVQQRTGLQNPSSWLFDALTEGVATASGVAVGATSAAAHADVYACVRVLADAVSSIPLVTYRRTDSGRERANLSPVARLMDRPSPMLTSSALWGLVVSHLNLHGDAFLAKLRPANGPVTRLWPVNPARVTVEITDGEPSFIVEAGDGQQGGTFNRRDILHVKALTFDGVRGVSPIGQARQAVGLGIALEEYAARWFANSSFPGGVIQMPGSLSETAAKRLKQDWEAFHRGLKNSSRVAVLEGGASFQSVTIPPEDAQFVEQRRMSATQIARVFRVPPWMIGADNGSSMTYSNVEQSMLQFAVYSVRPWCVAIEQALAADEDLYPDGGDLYPEFLMDALLRADTATRFEAYAKATGTWMTVNEVRRAENLPAVAGGDDIQPATGSAGAGVTPPNPAPAENTQEGRAMPFVYMPERDERMMRRAIEAASDVHLHNLREMTAELRDAVVNVTVPPGPAPVVNVTVPPSQPPDVVVNVPQQPTPTVHVEMPRERDKKITVKRDPSGRIKEATVEEE